MTLNLTPTQVVAAMGVLLALLLVWRSGSRRAHKAAEAARASARVVSLAGRVLATAAGMVGIQWLVITHPGNPTLLVVVLALPDLLAAHIITRALTVTSLDTTRHTRGGRR